MGLEAGDNIRKTTAVFHVLTIYKIHGGGKKKNPLQSCRKVVVV